MSDAGKEVVNLVRRLAPERPRWVLCAALDGGALKTIDRFEHDDDEAALVDRIEARAQRFANTVGGVTQMFELQAVDGNDKVIATEQWRGAPEVMPGGSLLGAELPNEGGLVAQMMRHTEVMFRSSIQSWSAQAKASGDMITRQAKELEASQRINLKAFKVIEEATGQQHLRDLEVRKLGNDQKNKEAVIEKVGNLLPLVGAAITKRFVPDGEALAAAQMAKALLESVDPAQLEKILQALSPEQQALVITFYKDTIAKRQQSTAPKEEVH